MDISKKLDLSELYSAKGLVVVLSGGGSGQCAPELCNDTD